MLFDFRPVKNMSKDRQQLRTQVKVIIFVGFVVMATGIFVELVVLK